jgi:hypothetical protein
MPLAYRLNRPVALSSEIDLVTGRGDMTTGFAGAYRSDAISRPDELAEYEQYTITGWDGFDAEPISSETVLAARRFKRALPRNIDKPDIAPGADGTIGFEWRQGPTRDRVVLFVEIGPGATIRASKVSRDRVRRWPSRHIGVGTYAIIDELFSPR